MTKDVICAEGELSIAMNKTDRYLDFLVECMSEYNQIMGEIPDGVLQDNEITQAMESFAGQVLFQKMYLNALSGFAARKVKEQIRDMEKLDKFDYPELSLTDLFSLLSSFL